MSCKRISAIFFILALATTPLTGEAAPTDKGSQPPRTQKRAGPDEETTRAYFTDLPLLTQQGKRVRFYTDVLKDRVVLINFIYTNCRDACPLLLNKLAVVKGQIGELMGREIFFVSISVDPARDTPEAMAKYAKQHKAEHPGWVYLTGEKENVKQILSRLGQYSPEVENHSTLFLAGNVKTRHWMKISPMAPPEVIALKLRDLVSDRAAAAPSGASLGSGRARD